MLSMSTIMDIKQAASEGTCIAKIARDTGVDRKTVRKYAASYSASMPPFKKSRKSKLTPCEEAIRDHLACTCSTTDAKQRLTAKRIHTMILNGELDEKLPPMEVSIRTVERMVKDLRTELKIQTRKRHLSLLHAPGDAQLDFGEVDVFIDGKTCRQYILVLTFPYSNYRLAQMLPAQNFECLAEGLVTMFEFIGRVPNRIRCDNMSTAVAKILHRSDIVEEHDVWDAVEHPRRLTDNFRELMYVYGFIAEFCNAASGYEKGSVENAVGWFRRNFFVPGQIFNGNYREFNKKLFDFCRNEAHKEHYKHKILIDVLHDQEKKQMKLLPQKRYVVCSWTNVVADNTCRISVDSNTYQGDFLPGQKIVVKKTWDLLEFYTERGTPLGTVQRSYSRGKDFINWLTEMELLSERPSAFKNSSFFKVLTPAVGSWMVSRPAPARKQFFQVCLSMLKADLTIDDICSRFDQAVREFGNCSNDIVVNALRGIRDHKPDEIQKLVLPDYLPDQHLVPLDMGSYVQGGGL